MKDSSLFLSNFIKNPKETGAVAPSSRFLTREIVNSIDFESSKNIVELGPGIGTFTKAILAKAAPDTKLFCFEVNEKFRSHLAKSISDERLYVIGQGAENLASGLKKLNVKKADCIVSGLPFKNFAEQKKRKIIKEVKSSLSGKGRFVLFQYTNRLRNMLESHFTKVSRKFVPLNLPPAFVYICEK